MFASYATIPVFPLSPLSFIGVQRPTVSLTLGNVSFFRHVTYFFSLQKSAATSNSIRWIDWRCSYAGFLSWNLPTCGSWETFIYPFLDKLRGFKFSQFWQFLLCALVTAFSQTVTHLLDFSGVSQKPVQHIIQTHRGIIKLSEVRWGAGTPHSFLWRRGKEIYSKQRTCTPNSL